jgi:peptidoglycan/LPS O-acetylase OafA/YrhL
MRIARSTGAASGLTIALLGLWGALIPFVGPYFHYSFGVDSAWHYTTDRLWLNILPGVAAVLAGCLLVAARTRSTGALGGLLAIAAGAWFVSGPAVSLTWDSGAGPIGPPLFGSTRRMLELVGYYYLLGALIVVLGAFALGRLVPARRIAHTPPLDGGLLVPASDATTPRLTTPPVPSRSAAAETEQGRGRGRVRLPRRRQRTASS